ncbi:MAG: transposase [Campylobacterales bacterium]
MGRSRYKIYEPTHPHFLTLTVLHWIPLFTNKDSVQILLDSLKHLQQNDNLKIYAYVILENHLHLVASSDDIANSMAKFKKYTARQDMHSQSGEWERGINFPQGNLLAPLICYIFL